MSIVAATQVNQSGDTTEAERTTSTTRPITAHHLFITAAVPLCSIGGQRPDCQSRSPLRSERLLFYLGVKYADVNSILIPVGFPKDCSWLYATKNNTARVSGSSGASKLKSFQELKLLIEGFASAWHLAVSPIGSSR